MDHPAIYGEALAPANLAELEADATRYINGVGKYWQITADNGAVSHLWGSYHSNERHVLALPERVIAQIAAARVVALETDFIYKSRRQIELSFRQDDRYRGPGQSIDREISDLPALLIANIRSRTHALGWGRDAADVLVPAAVIELIMSNPCDDFAAGVLPIQDDRIQMLGHINGAQILGLEPPNALFSKLSRPESKVLRQAMLMIYATYLNPQTSSKNKSTSIQLYLEGRTGVSRAWDRAWLVAQLGDAAHNLLDRVDAYLLDARNAVFVTKVKPDLQVGGVFMAVGAFHLSGKQGMVEMLRRDGFAVTRTPIPGELP
ncbi:MAG: TraB/GumN family protein [Sedimentitalea sp.]